MAYDAYTENLADFGMREIEELRDILTAWLDSGLPDDFYDEGVKPAFNRSSGYVFLTNDDYQVCMVVEGKLESFYTTPYSGHEGFYEDLLDEVDESWDSEDIEYLRDLAEARGDDEAIAKLDELLGSLTSGDDEIEESTRIRKTAVTAAYGGWNKFYGLPDVEFTVPNDTDDPTIFYNGKYYNYYDIEDTLWDFFREYCEETGVIQDEDMFEQWIAENTDYVYEVLENATPKSKPGRGVYRPESGKLIGSSRRTRKQAVTAAYGGWNKFYGLPDVEFTVPNDMDDPTIFYNGKYYNYYDIEDFLWELFKEDGGQSEDEFEAWVGENSDYVYEALENAVPKSKPGRGVYRPESGTMRGTANSSRCFKKSPVTAAMSDDPDSWKEVEQIIKAYEGTKKNPKTGWTGTVTIKRNDSKAKEWTNDTDGTAWLWDVICTGDAGSSSSTDLIIYYPATMDGGQKFVIYPESGGITHAKNLAEFKKALRSEYSYLR